MGIARGLRIFIMIYSEKVHFLSDDSQALSLHLSQNKCVRRIKCKYFLFVEKFDQQKHQVIVEQILRVVFLDPEYPGMKKHIGGVTRSKYWWCRIRRGER